MDSVDVKSTKIGLGFRGLKDSALTNFLSSLSVTRTCTRTNTPHTHAHTHVRTCTRTCARARTCTHTHIQTRLWLYSRSVIAKAVRTAKITITDEYFAMQWKITRTVKPLEIIAMPFGFLILICTACYKWPFQKIFTFRGTLNMF